MIRYYSEHPITPTALEIIREAKSIALGDEPVDFVEVRAPGKGVLSFGVDAPGAVRTLSVPQVTTQPFAVSALVEAFQLIEGGSDVPPMPTPHVNPQWLFDFDQPVVVDVENAPDGTLLSIAVCDGTKVAVYTDDHLFGFVAETLARFYYIIGHNLKYDVKVIERNTGYRLNQFFDTMLARHVMHPSAQGHFGLKDVARTVLGVGDWEADIKEYTKSGDYSLIPREKLVQYNGYDVWYTWHLYERFKPLVEHDPAFWHEMRAARTVYLPEFHGIAVDLEHIQNLKANLTAEAAQHREKLPMANPGSWQQVLRAIEAEGVPVAFKPKGMSTAAWESQKKSLAKKGIVTSTGEEVLEGLTGRVSFVSDLLAWRGATKALSTYCNSYLDKHQDGILYPTYNVHGTSTGRLSSNNPNIQNCVDGETEVLTPAGWVRFPDLLDGTPVYTVDPETGNGHFEVPETVIRKEYNGDMVRMSATWGEFLYTPEHRILSYQRHSDKPIFEPAETFVGPERIVDRKVMRASRRIGGRVLTSEERRYLEIAVMVSAEGYLRTEMGDTYEVTLRSARKQRQLRELWDDVRQTRKDGRLTAWIKYDAVAEWLEPGRAKNLRVAPILELCADDLDFLLERIMRWDGDYTRGRTFGQNAKRSQTVDVVQLAATLTGKSTTRYHRSVPDLDVVNVHNKDKRFLSRVETTLEPFTGVVYCVTVSTGAFLIRRGGTPLVTGNCPRDKRFRSIFVSRNRENGLFVNADYSQIELRTMALLSGDEAMQAMFQPGMPDYFDSIIPNAFPEYTFDQYIELKETDPVLAKELRTTLKSVVYGLSFGRGAAAIAHATGTTPAYAQNVIDNYLAGFPKLAEWRQRVMEAAVDPTKRDMLVTPFGRRFESEVVTSRNRQNVINAALAFLPQSTASDICVDAAAEVVKRAPEGVLLVGLVHDAQMYDVTVPEAAGALVQVLEDELPAAGARVFGDVVPFDIEVEVGETWT